MAYVSLQNDYFCCVGNRMERDVLSLGNGAVAVLFARASVKAAPQFCYYHIRNRQHSFYIETKSMGVYQAADGTCCATNIYERQHLLKEAKMRTTTATKRLVVIIMVRCYSSPLERPLRGAVGATRGR